MSTSSNVAATSFDITKLASSPIICRISRTTNKPIVFFTHTLDTGRLTGFTEGTLRDFGVDFYTSTLPLSHNDSLTLAKEWAQYAGIPSDLVAIRERLPRTHRVIQDRLTVVQPAVAETVQEKAVKSSIKRNAKKISARSLSATRRMNEDIARAMQHMAEKPAELSAQPTAISDEKQKKVQALAMALAKVLMDVL